MTDDTKWIELPDWDWQGRLNAWNCRSKEVICARGECLSPMGGVARFTLRLVPDHVMTNSPTYFGKCPDCGLCYRYVEKTSN